VTLTPRFTEALAFAALLHRNQERKGPDKVPYLAHLLLVAGTVLEYGGDEEEATAGLLHDAVEDQGGATTRETIRRMFGERVAGIVDGCTDAGEEPKPPWRRRKQDFIASLAEAPESVLLVVLADKLSNVRSTIRDLREAGEEIWSRFRGRRDGTLWYYRAIVDAIRPSERTAPLAREFAKNVKELEALAGDGSSIH